MGRAGATTAKRIHGGSVALKRPWWAPDDSTVEDAGIRAVVDDCAVQSEFDPNCPRNCMTALVCSWQARDSVTPRT